ncbi:MAG TPA: LytR C-terminal domain-containing protein [Gemmatimonadaceae bacterium]|nr:LytR C-terminal domain-containing protein [Gemmatimonadaceae bacterium]
MKIGRWILLALVLAGAGVFAWWKHAEKLDLPFQQASTATQPLVPPGVRIKVEVLNATKVRGLARRATMYLRDRGFDVVAAGTSSEQLSKTLILDRSNHPQWAALAARAFNARVESRPDSSRYLDVTVLIGSDWRPPLLPFYP